MNQSKPKIIYVATDTQLNDPQYYRRLWLATRNIDIARRDWLDAIADAIRDFDGAIAVAPDIPYRVPCIDRTFGDDPDVRWLGYFLAANDNGNNPKYFTRKLERLRLIDLYFRIRRADIARHFNR